MDWLVILDFCISWKEPLCITYSPSMFLDLILATDS